VVEDGVDTGRGDLADPGRDVWVVVVDGLNTEGTQLVVVPWAGGADDGGAGVLGELNEGGADSAARAVDQHGLPGLHVPRPERGGQTPGAGGKWASTIFGCPGWLARAGRRTKLLTGYTSRRATPQQTPADVAASGSPLGWS
jgi:hypothetical protein